MTQMAEGAKVDVPVVGKVNKNVAYGSVAVVVLLIGIYYVRKKNSAAAAPPASTTTNQYPPDGTVGDPSDPYSTDPATNQTYGDEAVGAGTYGSYPAGGVGSTGIIGTDSSGNPVYAPGYSPQPTGTSTGGPPFPNNSAWSNWVIQQAETNDPNVDIGAFTNALGLYLAGQLLNPTQKQYVFNAKAIAGDPPVAGAGGFPPGVRSEPTSTSGTHQVTVPNVVGLGFGEAYNHLVLAGLKSSPGSGGTHASWKVTKQSPAAGALVDKGTTVTLTVPDPNKPVPAAQVTVPNVVGMGYGEAHNHIIEAGLKVSPATGVNSNWRITSQSPAAGRKVAKNSTVTVKAVAQKPTRS